MMIHLRAILAASVGAVLLIGTANATILPPNDLDKEDGFIQANGMTEAEFNTLLSNVQKAYAPVVQAQGATLDIQGLWSNATVNAQASQQGSTWKVEIFGGLARRPEVSSDSVTLVTCHELGHHLAGFSFVAGMELPFPIPIPGFGNQWAANEGQSDYFSTHVCARKLWAGQAATNATFRAKANETVRVQCETVYKTVAEQNLCMRLNVAGMELATLLGAVGKTPVVPTFETPDNSTVAKTNDQHPAAQCRLDTYFAGSLCTAAWNEAKIPGKKHKDGQGSPAAEREASAVSCMKVSGYDKGLRPTCWFHPTL